MLFQGVLLTLLRENALRLHSRCKHSRGPFDFAPLVVVQDR
jgi:hypothetical protein